ncbi:MAG: AAA family ATPase [Chloroflexi bacterium]|nr:AAA family ATPase [Chloroflexota bacterium]
MPNKCDIIIIRGAPGSGKSTLARKLMGWFGRGVTVEVDDVRGMINQVDWEFHQQHFDAIKSSAELCDRFICLGYRPIVLVDTFGYGSLDIALNELGQHAYIVISLVTSNKALSWRMFRRIRGYRNALKAKQFNSHIKEDVGKDDMCFDTSLHRAEKIARMVALRVLAE